MERIALITPTSDRPIAFRLCEQWMSRAIAHYDGPFTWYVADDGTIPAQCTMGQVHIRREPSVSTQASFLGNMSALLSAIRETKILFIEDDDWYSPDYISTMARWLDDADLVGESHARYYNVPHRRYKLFPNLQHASLCQTGIRDTLLSTCKDLVEIGNTVFIDMPLWRIGQERGCAKLCDQTKRSLGIKGLPGKSGLNEGHLGDGWGEPDPDADLFRSWIGNDYQTYLAVT